MVYLYHRVPENLIGETLYPLNELKTLYPDVYAEHVKKYEGREEKMDRRRGCYRICVWMT